MKKTLLSLLVVILINRGFAGTVDTITIHSESMHKKIKCVVIKPDSYKLRKNRYPVVYLLHGHSGYYNNWIIRVPELKKHADTYQLLIVCPDGNYNSWYLDSPVDSNFKYETHVSKEVPVAIDKLYRTIPGRKHRAITGLSMGGHGGLFLGLRHDNIFGACGSMSGGVDLKYSTRSWELSQRLGDTASHGDNWINLSVIKVIEKNRGDSSKIIIDCGTEDFFYNINRKLHEKMLTLKIKHDYIERPGAHNWEYWKNAVKYQLLFFRNYFDSK